jgi:hypothetical protein
VVGAFDLGDCAMRQPCGAQEAALHRTG